MSPHVERIHSDKRLPADVDVVIVGGGILGSTAAYYLAKRGLSVALLEKGHVACEQSSRNWGWCRQQNRDRRELPLSVISMRLWDELTREIIGTLDFDAAVSSIRLTTRLCSPAGKGGARSPGSTRSTPAC